jgi:hypothetical protein
LPEKRTRMQIRVDAGGEPDFPFIEPELEHFVAHLMDVGPTSAGAMGSIPLTWLDLDKWQALTGIALHPWQLRLLRELSAEYLTESQTADEHDAPPPWNREADRERIAKHIRNVLRG